MNQPPSCLYITNAYDAKNGAAASWCRTSTDASSRSCSASGSPYTKSTGAPRCSARQPTRCRVAPTECRHARFEKSPRSCAPHAPTAYSSTARDSVRSAAASRNASPRCTRHFLPQRREQILRRRLRPQPLAQIVAPEPALCPLGTHGAAPQPHRGMPQRT